MALPRALPRAPRTAQVRVDVRPDLQRAIKVRAAREDTTITSLVIDALEREFGSEEREKQNK